MNFHNITGETADGKNLILMEQGTTEFYSVPKSAVLESLGAISAKNIRPALPAELQHAKNYSTATVLPSKEPAVQPHPSEEQIEEMRTLSKILNADFRAGTESAVTRVQEVKESARSVLDGLKAKIQEGTDKVVPRVSSFFRDLELFKGEVTDLTPLLSSLNSTQELYAEIYVACVSGSIQVLDKYTDPNISRETRLELHGIVQSLVCTVEASRMGNSMQYSGMTVEQFIRSVLSV